MAKVTALEGKRAWFAGSAQGISLATATKPACSGVDAMLHGLPVPGIFNLASVYELTASASRRLIDHAGESLSQRTIYR